MEEKRKYKVELKHTAQKQIRKLPLDILNRVREYIDMLVDNPRPIGAEKLKGFSNHYRIRVRSYRMVYDISDSEKKIIVVEIADRKDVYRRLGILLSVTGL